MQIDKILKHLKKEDLPDSLEAHIEYFTNIEFPALRNEKFFQEDGLDFIRYLIKYTDGITFKAPRANRIKGTILRYIRLRILETQKIQIRQLCRETGLDERTIRRYIQHIRKERRMARLDQQRIF